MFRRGRVFFAVKVFILSNPLRGGLGVDFVYIRACFYSFYAVADTFQNHPFIILNKQLTTFCTHSDFLHNWLIILCLYALRLYAPTKKWAPTLCTPTIISMISITKGLPFVSPQSFAGSKDKLDFGFLSLQPQWLYWWSSPSTQMCSGKLAFWFVSLPSSSRLMVFYHARKETDLRQHYGTLDCKCLVNFAIWLYKGIVMKKYGVLELKIPGKYRSIIFLWHWPRIEV